jgi:thiamine-monophosphate kinase
VTRPPLISGRSLALGPGAEFDRIRAIVQQLGPQAAGLGDDCGLIREDDEFLALSTDVSVEGVHFRTTWIRPEEAGWRASASALSDLAAEGAEPLAVLSAVTMPPRATERELVELMAGVGAAAKYAGAAVIGGDVSSAPGWTITVTVVGRTRVPVTRGGARPGDQLWVSGALGAARAALEAWRRGTQPSAGARQRFAHPEPRITAGRWLARHGARAMIDLSDGLAGDAGHVAAASEVSLEIDLNAVPIATDVSPEAQRLGISASQFAAEGGEDFELLVALPPRFNAADAFRRECGVQLTRIGTVAQGSGVRFVHDGGAIALKGFNHFG